MSKHFITLNVEDRGEPTANLSHMFGSMAVWRPGVQINELYWNSPQLWQLSIRRQEKGPE